MGDSAYSGRPLAHSDWKQSSYVCISIGTMIFPGSLILGMSLATVAKKNCHDTNPSHCSQHRSQGRWSDTVADHSPYDRSHAHSNESFSAHMSLLVCLKHYSSHAHVR